MRTSSRAKASPVPGRWRTAIDQWAVYARTQTSVSLATIQTRREHLERCARTVGCADPWKVSGEWLYGWFDSQPWARETRRSHRATLRGFYGWGVACGHVKESPASWLPSVRAGKPNPHPTLEDDYWRAVQGADVRELVMLRLGVEVGFRRAEIAKAHSRDLIKDLEGWSLRAHGKGDRERVLPLPEDLARVLRAMPAGYFFPGSDHGHLSPRWVGTLVSRLLPVGYSAHSLRHLFATRAHAASGRDLLVVCQLLGHASVETTRVYIGEVETRLRDAVVGAAAMSGPRVLEAVDDGTAA